MGVRSPYFYNIPYLIIYISFVSMTHHFSLPQWKINKVIASRREPWDQLSTFLYSLSPRYSMWKCEKFWRIPISCLFINIFMAVPYKKSPGNFVIFDLENLENLEFFRCQNIPTRYYKALDSSVPLLITWSTSFRRASYFYFHIIIWRVSGANLLTDITFNKKVKTKNFVWRSPKIRQQ